MSAGLLQLIGLSVAVLLAVLYKAEVSTRQDDFVYLVNKSVVLTSRGADVFSFISDLQNYHKWFPGIDNMTVVHAKASPVGQRFGQVVHYPLIGAINHPLTVTVFQTPSSIHFRYDDWALLTVIITVVPNQSKGCTAAWGLATQRTSLLFHATAGPGLSLIYTMKARQALFAIRSMFLQQQQWF